MPIPGLSLLGFLPQDGALNYFRNACVPAASDDAALVAEWNAAKALIGPVAANAGNPAITAIAPADVPYMDALKAGPWKAQFDANPTWDFAVVEIAPLLAFQFSILMPKSANHCSALPTPPTVTDLLPVCLPQTPPTPSAHVSRDARSVMIQSRDLNLRAVDAGLLNFTMGLQFTFALPFAHVVRFGGRCYLLNGFHRAYGAAQAGATEMPCIFRDVATPEEAGIRSDGTTFDLATLQGPNPPSMRHYISGQAYGVQLKPLNRVLHVSWAEYLVPDEEF
jgi:hypothetical protein